MAKPPGHAVPPGDGWANKREGSSRVSQAFDRKADAQAAGRVTAKRAGTEHLNHNRDGRTVQRNSYGNDPHPPKG